MRGDGCEVKFLSQTGIERADAIVAVTADDEDNLIALQMAKRHFKVKKTIARVNNPSNVEIFKTLGVDEAVSATEVCSGAGATDHDLTKEKDRSMERPSRKSIRWTCRSCRSSFRNGHVPTVAGLPFFIVIG